MKSKTFIVFFLIILMSCNSIETGKTLDQEDIAYIKSMNLLDDDETIIKFYSEYKNKVAGNFFTDKRIAKYWMDERNSEKNTKVFAYYPEVIKIDTVYYAGLTYSPYMLITKSDSSKFKVSVGGEKGEIKAFFEDAIQEWRKRK